MMADLKPNKNTAAKAADVAENVEKTAEVFLSRALNVIIDGVTHTLKQGANVVHLEVAGHWLVKAHAVVGAVLGDGSNAAVAALQEQLAAANARADAAEKKAAELQVLVDAFNAAAAQAK